MPRRHDLRGGHLRRDALETRQRLLEVGAFGVRYGPEEPGTGSYAMFGRIRALGIKLAQFDLGASQVLPRRARQPFDGGRPVADSGMAVVIHAVIEENAEIELRDGVAFFGGAKQVLRGRISDGARPVGARRCDLRHCPTPAPIRVSWRHPRIPGRWIPTHPRCRSIAHRGPVSGSAPLCREGVRLRTPMVVPCLWSPGEVPGGGNSPYALNMVAKELNNKMPVVLLDMTMKR